MCSVTVKVSLFKAYCTPLYTAHLWCRYRQNSMRKLTVAYNDCMRLLLKAPRSSSASHMFVNVGVPTCPAVLRNLMYTFLCRVCESVNDILVVLTNHERSSVKFSSSLWNHWRKCLYAARPWVCWLHLYWIFSFYCIVSLFLCCFSFSFFTMLWIFLGLK